MPPVFGPASLSKARLKSCAGASGITVTPSDKKNRLTSGPDRNSSTKIPMSINCLACSRAAAESSVTMTPLPAAKPSALITYGAPKSSMACSTSASVLHCLAIAVGTPAAAITSLANDLLPSSWAASLLGPKTAIPCERRASDTPATNGASGPMMASSIWFSRANLETARGSVGSRSVWHSTWAEIPLLPGATMISLGFVPVLIRALTMACSLAPCPKTRIFIFPSLVSW